jgi:ribosome recycling factor
MNEAEIKKRLSDRLERAKERFSAELNTVRAGRANPSLLDRVFVEYYETPTPLKSLANIAAPDPASLLVSPFDPANLKAIERGIADADLGVAISNDGKVIRLSLPKLTEERRKELTKVVKKFTEDAKIAIRNERRTANEALKKLEKEGEYTEDDLHSEEKEVQKKVDDAIRKIEEAAAIKEKELVEL